MMAMMMTEADPAMSLPLLLGLSRSTGYSKKKKKKGKRKNSAANASTATSGVEKSDKNKADGGTTSEKEEASEKPEKLPKLNHLSPHTSFPAKIHALLSSPHFSNILSWMPHGRSWKILDTEKFEQEILKDYFADLLEDGSNDYGKPTETSKEAEGGEKQEAKETASSQAAEEDDSKKKKKPSAMETFHQELLHWGFHLYNTEGSLDEGSYYNEEFLRCCLEKVGNMRFDTYRGEDGKGHSKDGEGGGDVDMQDASKTDKDGKVEGKKDTPEEPPIIPNEAITNFLAFTGTSNPSVASQYLEMSGQNLEMSVSLYMDHGALGLGNDVAGLGGMDGNLGGAGSLGGLGGLGSVMMESIAAPTGPTDTTSTTTGKGGSRDSKKEPDFYAMPFMPPLPLPREERTILPAERIVDAALKEYGAFRTLRRALLVWVHKRRAKLGVVQGVAPHSGTQAQLLTSRGLSSTSHHEMTHLKEYNNHGTSHFLFQSLLHSSLPVRRAAVRMILHNLHHTMMEDENNTSGTRKNNGGMQEILVILLHNLMFGEAPYQSQHQQSHSTITSSSSSTEMMMMMMIPKCKNQAEGGDPALQLMAMLVSLVCDGGFSNILVGEQVKEIHRQSVSHLTQPALGGGILGGAGGIMGGRRSDVTALLGQHGIQQPSAAVGQDDMILANSLLKELGSYGIESFVAAGGLRWACGSIVRLVHMLVHGPASMDDTGNNGISGAGLGNHGGIGNHPQHGSDSDGSHPHHNSVERMEDITARTIQTRLLLLIDLVYRMVLFGSVPAAVDKNTSLSATSMGGEDGNNGPGDDPHSNKDSKKPSSSKDAADEAAAKERAQSRRNKSRELYELLCRGDNSAGASAGAGGGAGETSTSRTSALLRQSLRSSVGSPPSWMSGGGGGGGGSRAKRSRSASGGSLAAAGSTGGAGGNGGSSGGAGGDGSGNSGPSAAASEENRRRKESRRETLERVHRLFWSSTLPAAVCVPEVSGLTSPAGSPATNAHNLGNYVHSTDKNTDHNNHQAYSSAGLSPLACLIAAHEILRSRPTSSSTLATNSQLRGLEKGIAVLGRIVDPGATKAVVVVDGELPWGLMSVLSGDKSSIEGAKAAGVGKGKSPTRKRDRASSHESQRSRSSSGGNGGGRATRASARAAAADSSSPASHRAKRARTSGSVSSLLERLTQVDANAASSGGAGTSAATRSALSAAQSAREEANAAAASLSSAIGGASGGAAGSSSSLFASRYRSAMESMLRGSSPAAGSGSGGASASRSRNNERDGSLSRILASASASSGTRASASGGGLTSVHGALAASMGLGGRPGSSHSASTSASPAAAAAGTSASRAALLRARTALASHSSSAAAAAEAEEWRVLHELPEGADVMDVDFGHESSAENDVANNNNEGESGEVDEGNAGEENSDEEDSDAESAFEEVEHVDGDDDDNDAEEHHDDDSDDNSNEDGNDNNNNYDEETDEDEDADAYDSSQFEDAVINLDDINISGGAGGAGGRGGEDHHGHGHHHSHHHHHHHHAGRNPHRHSASGRSPSSRLGTSSVGGTTTLSPVEIALKKREREQAFLCAAMSILAAQYPESNRGNNSGSSSGEVRSPTAVVVRVAANPYSIFASPSARITPPLLTLNSEQSLLKSLCNIVKPPRKPLNLKIFLRRAPTQEEFFRGSLSRNPIGLSSLRAAGGASGGGAGSSSGGAGGEDRRSSSGGGGGASSSDKEPLVSDLRLHIAKDLQMQDSAELLELLVANKILDMNLKLRVVQQVLWKKYVEENATSASSLGVAGAGPSHQMISTGSGLSMIFSSSGLTAARNRSGAGGAAGGGGDDNAILASFPPMVVTYRLAGVDGEATEDKVELEDLDDPEAPSTANSSPAAIERRMEKEFGITRMLTREGGVAVLLASVKGTIADLLRRMRRDEVARRRRLARNIPGAEAGDGNTMRENFAKASPCPGLVLLRHCANLADNRRMMLANRAPTLLLRILLDILNAVNRSSSNRRSRKRSSTFDFSGSMDVDEPVSAEGNNEPSSTRSKVHHVEGNPTTDALQEIIEMLASDISAEVSDESKSKAKVKKGLKKSATGSFLNLNQAEEASKHAAAGQDDEDRTLPLVLKSLHSTDLSPPLRKVIAKLLPFLTYGQVSQSRELASYFSKYVNVQLLGAMEASSTDDSTEQLQGGGNGGMLMNTFVETAINLPPVSVCDNLRKELIANGFVESVRAFLMEGAPSRPPPWSPALYAKSAKKESESNVDELKEEWRSYFDRPGLSQAFKVLTGLCTKHDATQLLLSDICEDDMEEEVSSSKESSQDFNLLTLCHWMESTSDNTASGIKNPNGILAETLLDALKEDNELTSAKIGAVRKKTRDRKRELAEERRSKALVGMSAFGKLAGAAVAGSTEASRATASTAASNAAADDGTASGNRSMFASMFSSLLAPASSSSSQQRTTRASAAKGPPAPSQPKAQPSWMAEMEAMADEAGVTCAVCQEGRTLQPSELLGLYAYIKKVSITTSQGGGKGDIDGTVLLLSLPTSFPISLMNATSEDMEILFQLARNAANALEGSSHAISAMSASSSGGAASITGSGGSNRTNYYITAVSAGNAIHCSCHKRAKAADRNHPKAPKSEWEGASLRNSRVTCNVILPLVSSKTSKVPLMAVETALADYNAIVTNTLGARPKSILWNCLHDIRFLLLRMAHGEALGADCGGGSSSSNFLLVLYQLYSADMFAKNAEHDESVEVSRHARGLSAGFLVGVDVVDDPEFDRMDSRSKRLERGVADAAPMAALLSILFYNSDDNKPGVAYGKTHDISGSSSAEETGKKTPSPNRQWELYKSKFLIGLIRCAGHRHSLGVTDSGCVTSRGISTGRKNVEKARSFADWSVHSDEDSLTTVRKASLSASRRSNTMIEEYSSALRPMITMYAMFDQLSKEFVVNNDDESTEDSSERLAAKLESCYKADGIQELLRIAEIAMGQDTICKYFEKGCTS